MSSSAVASEPSSSWLPAVQTGAALAAAIGVGRFVFTPILPLMEGQVGLTPADAGLLASVNYLGYLLGALLGIAVPFLGQAKIALRSSGVVLVLSLCAMALTQNLVAWSFIRTVAGIASAVVFMVAANAILTQISSAKAHLVGWAYGGLGVGITLSGALVTLVSQFSDWRAAWLAAAALTTAFTIVGWNIGASTFMRQRSRAAAKPATATLVTGRQRLPFTLLMTSYVLEGAGYIIAGTFLVAAVTSTGPAWLAGSIWMIVGIAVVPSCLIWAALANRFSRHTLLTVALVLQAIGIALPALSESAIASFTAAVLFGATFMGIVTLAMSIGRSLAVPNAVALLTAAYSLGQVVGPISVIPLLADGYSTPLLVGAGIVLAAALASALIRAKGLSAGDAAHVA